jgi:hypothetical protein
MQREFADGEAVEKSIARRAALVDAADIAADGVGNVEVALFDGKRARHALPAGGTAAVSNFSPLAQARGHVRFGSRVDGALARTF